jgi:ribosomal protein S17
MATVEKKIWPEYFQQIIDGSKKYEFRLADFDCTEGDILMLKEWDPTTETYSGRSIEKEITHVIKTKDKQPWSQEEIDKYGFQIISFE